uniref:Capsid protein n=2 Tax=Rat stool-associated circular ssDNA virus TaxID=1699316 RepID=A0A0S2LVN1_9VIRU|nr:hypothetical protein [Rat stool-associated circular ssDNA virus]ALO65149.1 hypothetical protein [Rat stool-associated circular ssDNA virus]ALO65160.1 hypothetical protein [Rat stool-associated circular ssDNA virus]ALO65163.1 hypothetical protein [Rat stool-associated circular ssDNA virus]ALO65166.1 hypothetical protein [Rat stool-associated circular ssDNA virus]
MARWYRRYRRSSYRRSGKKWSPATQVVHRATGGGQNTQVIALNSLNSAPVGQSKPLGPIMKVKNFRINIVFASSVSVLWALVYVPEGMPIGTLNYSISGLDSPAGVPNSLYEPQQYLIASGLYSSAAVNSGANAGPLRVWSPLARNLNPGDGIFFIWRALENVAGVDTFFTFHYACCVN